MSLSGRPSTCCLLPSCCLSLGIQKCIEELRRLKIRDQVHGWMSSNSSSGCGHSYNLRLLTFTTSWMFNCAGKSSQKHLLQQAVQLYKDLLPTDLTVSSRSSWGAKVVPHRISVHYHLGTNPRSLSQTLTKGYRGFPNMNIYTQLHQR